MSRLTYAERSTLQLRAVSFHIPAGMRVGIVGPSGVNLLTRFHDPARRRAALLMRRDLRDYRQTALRNEFAIVPPVPQLFSITIVENTRYGNLQATDTQVAGEAKAAPSEQFICVLPEKYDTHAGERRVPPDCTAPRISSGRPGLS